MADVMTIEDMCAVIDEGKRTVEQQARQITELQRRNRELDARNSQVFEMYRAARDGLWVLRNANRDVAFLRDAAERIDCGPMCECSHIEGDTGAHVCSKEGSDEECASFLASQIRELADAFDALRLAKAEPTPTELHAEAWEEIAAEKAAREARMPDEATALRQMFDAWTRLKELGFKEARYGPRGVTVEVIEIGSTGIHQGYMDEKSESCLYWLFDNGDLWPSRPILYRTLSATAPSATVNDGGAD